MFKYIFNVMGGVIINGVMLVEWGKVFWVGKGIIVIGRYFIGRDDFVDEVVLVFNEVGIDMSVMENVIGWKWVKVIVNFVINGFGIVFEVKNGYFKDDFYFEGIFVDIVREGCMVV